LDFKGCLSSRLLMQFGFLYFCKRFPKRMFLLLLFEHLNNYITASAFCYSLNNIEFKNYILPKLYFVFDGMYKCVCLTLVLHEIFTTYKTVFITYMPYMPIMWSLFIFKVVRNSDKISNNPVNVYTRVDCGGKENISKIVLI